MITSEVIEKFSALSGVSGEALNKWSFLCEDSIVAIRAKLRSWVNEEEHEYILCAAAAALSYYKYVLCMLIRNEMDSDSEYAVNNSITKGIAQTVWMDYKGMISHLLVDDQFTFIVTI